LQIDSDKTAPCDLPDDLDIREGEQCKLNLGSYKMVKVVKSEDYLYRKEAFTRAAKVHYYYISLLATSYYSYVSPLLRLPTTTSHYSYVSLLLRLTTPTSHYSCVSILVDT